MATPPTPEQYEDRARQLLEEQLAGRMSTVQAMARTRTALREAKAVVTERQKEDAEAYAACTRAGWTEQELDRVGVSPPEVRVPGRPRNRKQRGQGQAETVSTADGEHRENAREEQP